MHSFRIKKLIKYQTRVTCNSSSILDNVLAGYPGRISRGGVIEVGISDYQFNILHQKNCKN